MKSVLRQLLLLSGLLCTALGSAAEALRQPPEGAVVVQPAELRAAEANAAALAAQWLAQWPDIGAPGIRRHIEAAPALQGEAAAADLLDRLTANLDSQPRDALLQLLEMLDAMPTRVYRAHDESASQLLLPVFDIAGRAATLRSLLAASNREREFAELLQRDPVTVARISSSLGERESRQLASAFAAADPVVVEAVARYARTQPVGAAVWRVLLQRAPAPDLYHRAAVQLAPGELLPLLPLAQEHLPAAAAVEWLRSIARQPQLTSAAVMQVGALAAREPLAESALLDFLGSPDGGPSAAAALARMPGDRVGRIKALLVSKGRAEPPVIRHLALALQLEGSAEARRVLQTLAQDPRLHASTRRELQR